MNEESVTQNNGPEWSRRRKASLGLVGVIVALGILVTLLNLFGGKKSGDDAAPAAAPSPSTSKAEDIPQDAKSKCGLPGYDTSGLVRQAPQAQWSIVGTVAAPDVDKSGPGKTDPDGFRHCYAHTRQGALLAAANYVAMSTDQSLNKKMAREALVSGPGRDAAIKAAATADTTTSARGQIAGFNMTSYNASSATVDVALNMADGQKFSVTYYLGWEGGDWKMKVNDAGELLSKPTPVDSLTGFVTWAGV